MNSIQIITLLVTFIAIYTVIIGWQITRDLNKALERKLKEEEPTQRTSIAQQSIKEFKPLEIVEVEGKQQLKMDLPVAKKEEKGLQQYVGEYDDMVYWHKKLITRSRLLRSVHYKDRAGFDSYLKTCCSDKHLTRSHFFAHAEDYVKTHTISSTYFVNNLNKALKEIRKLPNPKEYFNK